MSDVSPGEIGGIFAGITTLLVAVGAGIKWFFGYRSAAQVGREAKLERWHNELLTREAKIDAEQEQYRRGIESDLAELRAWKKIVDETQVPALKTGYQLIASALRVIDPGNQALRMGDEILRAAFPLDPATPPSMGSLLVQLDQHPSTAPPGSGPHPEREP